MFDIKCNNSLPDLQKRATGFESISSFGIFKFCTGAIDGIAITIECPKTTLNQKRYYSGSKMKYCINLQAVCDANCRFIGISMKHVGSTNDSQAFSHSTLSSICKSQIFFYHWNGDAAYPLSDTMMIPYGGINLHINYPEKESFNF